MLDALSAREVEDLDLPTAQPLLYRFDDRLRTHQRDGSYLDRRAAATGVAAVAAEGDM